MAYSILSVNSDAKTIKGVEYGYLTGMFYGAPGTLAGPKSTCPFMTRKCFDICIFDTGLASVTPGIKSARVRKTQLMLNDEPKFKALLRSDIHKLKRAAKKRALIPAVRLNGTTDRFAPRFFADILSEFADVQFYDYTKWPIRLWRDVPANLHLTFSLSDTNESDAIEALNAGINVAVPFVTIPTSFFGRPVLPGDDSDLRFLDGSDVRVKDSRGFIIGLTVKGVKGKRTGKNGFIR